MATRPVFVPRWDGVQLVEEIPIEFKWHPGFAPVQKKKNINELHTAAKSKGLLQILEVSTKSEEKIGICLSAFNLKVELPSGKKVPLEAAYQGSKVFQDGGPFTDLYWSNPRDAKRDERLRSSGALRGFKFGEVRWALEPKTAFYDWLYIYALRDQAECLTQLFKYDAFSDIEFNPDKSLNCQARSCAILVSLLKKQLFPKVVYDRELFISILQPDSLVQLNSQGLIQGSLF